MLIKKTAEVAMKEFAELNQLQFVSDEISVIVVTILGDKFSPVELTPDGRVIEAGETTSSLGYALEKGMEIAESRSLPFINLRVEIPREKTFF